MDKYKKFLLVILSLVITGPLAADVKFKGKLDGTFFTGHPDGDGGVKKSPHDYFYIRLEGYSAEILYNQLPGEARRQEYADNVVGMDKSSGHIKCTKYIQEISGTVCGFALNVKKPSIEPTPH